MSIPPLVCSTPPPPDQCEDDKDHDDFDLQYNLSQEDDDENFDYGDYSTYNHFQNTTSGDKQINVPVSPDKSVDKDKNNESQRETCYANDESLRIEEDINIEDLNLEIDKVDSLEIASPKESPDVDSKPSSESEVPESPSIVKSDLDVYSMPSEINTELPSTSQGDVPSALIEECTEEENKKEDMRNVELKTNPNVVIDENNLETGIIQLEKPLENMSLKKIVEDDDFGEFDDFKVNLGDFPTVVDSEDPWGKSQCEESGFGDFKANFDENEINFQCAPIIETQQSTESNSIKEDIEDKPEEDDFGDFDDFQSSTAVSKEVTNVAEEIECQQVPMLNLNSSDNEAQFLEAINKVIDSIFEEEIPEPETEFEGKFETVLGETWGHLLETDERQPYIVNWNNSLGQKTLLKALCIDSRNILFGPKWNYNMPKYAANLSVAPLQPQKQAPSSNPSQNEVSNPEKTSAKATGVWSDPFISEGQESCSTENETAHTEQEIGPTDLDVFEASISSKPEKIFSSTLSVQPIRQINLPDTHIFTPTDSETPRSKTIHYDVILPSQKGLENNPNLIENMPSTSHGHTVTSNLENDDEYWEFEGFKGAVEAPPPIDTSQTTRDKIEDASLKNGVQNANITYGTQVLQPVKVEPIMPVLNWPDPGEIKETFDDFSDFVTSTGWTSDKQEDPSNSRKNIPEYEKHSGNSTTVNKTTENQASDNNDDFDDEFDTFQSALPPSKSLPFEFSFNSLSSNPNNISSNLDEIKPPQKNINVDYTLPKSKSESISVASLAKTNDGVFPNQISSPLNNISKTSNSIEFKSPLQLSSAQTFNANLLQPTPASSSAQNQKSAQILQPLSLESYSQINWPNPGIDLQDLSRFNPVETLHSLKTDLSSGNSKVGSPINNHKNVNNQVSDDDWGEFVSIKPKPQQTLPKKPFAVEDDEWSDFVSSPSVKPQNGLNTISYNVHTNLNIQKAANPNKFAMKTNQIPLDIPTLNYITPKSSSHKSYNDRQFQNL